MFFQNKLALKILIRENARLRQELRRKEQQYAEVLDNFLFHKVPERLVNRTVSSAGTSSGSYEVSSHPSDAYSTLVNELEKEIDQKYPNGYPQHVDLEDLTSDDD